jgi:outer membrane protein assembly factor BamD (BamD/ComL family)
MLARFPFLASMLLLVSLPTVGALPAAAQKKDAELTPAEKAWEWFNEQGLNFLEARQYDDAERMFRAALGETEKFGADDERTATTYSNLGSV